MDTEKLVIEPKRPNYRIIYTDIIRKKYPEKEKCCKEILSKNVFTVLDILTINDIIFSDNKETINHKYRSYDKFAIFQILDFQKKNNLSNIKVAQHFQLSRNSIGKWKKIFL